MPIEMPTGKFAVPCLFCEALAGRVTKGVVQQSELVTAFVNGRQFEEGQVVIVPNRHVPTILELTAAEAAELFQTAQRMAQAMVRAYAPDGFTLYQLNGVASRQEVPHVHLHVVPRRANSERWGSGPPPVAQLMGEPLQRPGFDPTVSTERELEIAAFLRRYL